jgi:hypothetical protein
MKKGIKKFMWVLIPAILVVIIPYIICSIVFDLSVIGKMNVISETNKTYVDIIVYNDGFNVIRELDFHFISRCGELYSPEIISTTGICKVNPSNSFSCEEIDWKGGIEIGFMIAEPPANECNVYLIYSLNLANLYLPLIDRGIVYKINSATDYQLKLNQKDIRETENRLNFEYNAESIRNHFYEGGMAVIRTDIISNETQQYKLTGEWFTSATALNKDTLIGSFENNLIIPDQAIQSYYHWSPIHVSEDISEGMYLGTLRDSKKNNFQKEVKLSIIKDKELTPFLGFSEGIDFDKNVTSFVIDKIQSVNMPKDEEAQAKILLNATRDLLIIPPEVNKRIYFDENNISSLEAFYSNEGTISEFNYVYVMFLRSIGIPAKISYTDNYFYSEVYIYEKGWVPVDVYNTTKTFGE